MKSIQHNPSLNATQLFVLKTFAMANSEREEKELTALYLNYVRQKLDKAANDFWDRQNLDNTKMEELMYGHSRTSGNGI